MIATNLNQKVVVVKPLLLKDVEAARLDFQKAERFNDLPPLSQLAICRDFIESFQKQSGLLLTWQWVQSFFSERNPAIVEGQISPISANLLQQALTARFQIMLTSALAEVSKQYS